MTTTYNKMFSCFFYVLDTVNCFTYVNVLPLVFEIGSISPILQLRKLRHREVK